MLKAINIRRSEAKGEYADVIDACEKLMPEHGHSAVKALASMVRASPLFTEASRLVSAARRRAKRQGRV